jgi:PilZ domain-containing protein
MSPMPGTGVERRVAPRAPLALDVTLSRGKGGPISGRTVDVGTGGMRIATGRPLSVDELLTFELPTGSGAQPVAGRARVLREHAKSVYALRIEQIADEASTVLSGLVTNAAGTAV